MKITKNVTRRIEKLEKDFEEIKNLLIKIEGTTWWDNVDKTLQVKTDVDATLQIGQEFYGRGINKTGSQLDNGTVVYVGGGDAGSERPTFAKASATSWETSQNEIGVLTHDVANNTEGFATLIGLVRGLDTSGLTVGDPIYLSETDGEFTGTKPSAPAFPVTIGLVIKVGVTDGVIFVKAKVIQLTVFSMGHLLKVLMLL